MDYDGWFENMMLDDFLFYLLLTRVSTSSKKLIKELYDDALNYIDDVNNHEQVDKAVEIVIKHLIKRWKRVDYITRRLYYSQRKGENIMECYKCDTDTNYATRNVDSQGDSVCKLVSDKYTREEM